MRHPNTFNHADAFQFYRLRAEVVEKADTGSQQHGDKVNTNFVNESGPDRLLRHIRAADTDVLAFGKRLCLRNCAFNVFGDKGKRRLGMRVDPRLRDVVGQHNNGDVHRMSSIPPVHKVEQFSP